MSERDGSDAGPSNGDDAESSTDVEERTSPDDPTSAPPDDTSEQDPILDLDDASSGDTQESTGDEETHETVSSDEETHETDPIDSPEEDSDGLTAEDSDRSTEEDSDELTEENSDRSTEEDSDELTEENSDRSTEERSGRSSEPTEHEATQDRADSGTATSDRSSSRSDTSESGSESADAKFDQPDAHRDTIPSESEEADPVETEEIDPAELTVPLRSLDPRVRYLWILKSAISATFAGAIAAVIDAFVLGVGPVVPLAIGTSLFVLGAIHAVLRYRVWQYEVREDALYLERGVLTRVKTVVPFVRIQHVDTSRGPVERATGLATSVVYTAGSRGADVTIPGLTVDRAEDMQHRLKRLAIAAEDDTTV